MKYVMLQENTDRAIHEDNFWSSWLRGDERGKKGEDWQEPRRMKKKGLK